MRPRSGPFPLRVGSFSDFLILGFRCVISLDFPELVVFGSQLLEIGIDVFHCGSDRGMAQKHLELLHVKSFGHPGGSQQVTETVGVQSPYSCTLADSSNELPATLAGKRKDQMTSIGELAAPLEIFVEEP
jgi:hypothetical protein